MIIKYNADGKVVWGASVGGSNFDDIATITETTDGGIVVGGHFDSETIKLDNGQVLEAKRWYRWNDNKI